MTGREAWEALEQIRIQHAGVLLPEHVIEAAADSSHPLHGEFVWDDSEAARLFRLDQARQLIRRVRLVDADHPSAPRDLRAYMNVRTGGQSGQYLPTEQVAADPVARSVILRTMEREWRALYRRYKDFAEFSDMVRADLRDEIEATDLNGL